MFGGLDECMEDVMSRFMRGLNSEIQTLLISTTYSHISHLFCIARDAEKQILLSANICKNDVTHNDQHISTLHARKEQQVVEPYSDLPLSQGDLFAEPCDKEELCDSAPLISSLQLEHGCAKSVLNDLHAVSTHVHCIASKKEELKLLPSFNALGYIEFDIHCNLNCLKQKLKSDSGLPSFDGCSLHAIGKYDSKGECFVRKVYFSSNLKSPFGLQHHDQIGGYTNANDVFSSFPSFVLMQQVQPQERKHCWMWPCNITNAPRANIKASTLAGHWSKSGDGLSSRRGG